LTGRARSLANLRPFVKGQIGNTKGRPKDLARFGDILMREFYKTVPVKLAGKTVNKTQGEIVALGIVKNAILNGPAAMSMLVKFIEARRAKRREALKAK
jgi:Family of unknown function (DUF5681)